MIRVAPVYFARGNNSPIPLGAVVNERQQAVVKLGGQAFGSHLEQLVAVGGTSIRRAWRRFSEGRIVERREKSRLTTWRDAVTRIRQ